MTNRRILSGATLIVLMSLLAVGAYVGWQRLSAPVPERDEPTKASGPRCDGGVARGDVVRTRDITVSVYNAGSRSGLAGQTMSELEARGFIPGDVGNAPAKFETVRWVRVLAPSKKDPAARLVALQFGKQTLVQAVKRDLGPGVEVIVGDKFLGLVDARQKLKARASGSGC